MSQATREAINAISAWIAAGRPRHEWMAGETARAASRAVADAIAAAMPAQAGFWRGTNRAEEAADVAAGLAIQSRNHVTGELEDGLSVSSTLATVWAYGYAYAYRVDGDVVGAGSDGEPLIANARPIGAVMSADDAIASDERRAAHRAVVAEMAAATGLTPDMIGWLASR